MKPEILSTAYLRALFYGDSGVGKTHLLSTAMQYAETSPMLVMNARGQPITFRRLGDNIPLVMSVNHMKDFNEIYSWVMDDQPLPKQLHDYEYIFGAGPGASNEDAVWQAKDLISNLPETWNYVFAYLLSHKTTRFKSIAFDSITQIQRIANNVVLDVPVEYVPDTIPSKRGYTEYQKLLDLLMRFADYHYKLPVHVFMTALCRHSEMVSSNITMYYPFLWGQAALEVPSYAELVGRLIKVDSLATQQARLIAKDSTLKQSEPPFNILLTQGGRDYIAKWQGPENPPDVVVDPTIEKLLNVLWSTP